MDLVIIILQWLLAIIAVESITEIVTTSSLFEPIRDKIHITLGGTKLNLVSELIQCGYCFSTWVAIAIAWALPGAITGYLIVDIIIKTFALQRLSNWIHELSKKWLAYIVIEDGEQDDTIDSGF